MAGKIKVAGLLVNQVGEIIGEVQNVLKGTGRHDLMKGTPKPGDVLIYQEQRRAGYTLTYATYDFEYIGDKTITAIFANDNWDDDTGGDAEIIKGGIGMKYVTVRVTSKLLRGFDFTVYVYGR